VAEKTEPRMTEKESRTEDVRELPEQHVAITEGQEIPVVDEGEEFHVVSHVWFVHDAEAESAPADAITREHFESALDKVSRPVKGKYADVPYSSEDLIREKRTEAELEDR
jgi:hypothetical protein